MPWEGRLSDGSELWLFVVIGLCVGWIRQLPPFLNTPVALPPPDTLCSQPSELKIRLCEPFEKAGLVWGLRVAAVANHRAELSLHL